MTYAFYFDATYCTGCKACQLACKDKNHLPLGVLWRRVYEISGGSWRDVGVAQPNPGVGETMPVWQSDIFAYNLTLACNHCEHPVCAGVCPTQAYAKLEDGLVLLDTAKCIGCQYCAWACPYGAPQYDALAGTMTKCNFCAESLQAGQPPACVAACPMRTLDYGQRLDLEALPGVLPAIHPMTQIASRDPNILIKPHRATAVAMQKNAIIANREEVTPHKPQRMEEAPLVAFTLLAQMAIGAFWSVMLLAFSLPGHTLGEQVSLDPMKAIGVLIATALAASFFHLGRPKNAWRVLAHLGKSWLSREILFMLAFAAAWLLMMFSWRPPLDEIFSSSLPLRSTLVIFTALLGAAGIYSMARIYRLKTVPAWCNWRVMAGFFVAAALLGQSLVASFLAVEPLRELPVAWQVSMGVGLVILLSFHFWLVLSSGQLAQGKAYRWRLVLIGAGMLMATLRLVMVDKSGAWLAFPIFLIIFVEEIIGRWLFYRLRRSHPESCL